MTRGVKKWRQMPCLDDWSSTMTDAYGNDGHARERRRRAPRREVRPQPPRDGLAYLVLFTLFLFAFVLLTVLNTAR